MTSDWQIILAEAIPPQARSGDPWQPISKNHWDRLTRCAGAEVKTNAMGAQFIFIGTMEATVGGKTYVTPRLVATLVPDRTPLCRGRAREK